MRSFHSFGIFQARSPQAQTEVARFPASSGAPDGGKPRGDLLTMPQTQHGFDGDRLTLRIADLPRDLQELQWCLP